MAADGGAGPVTDAATNPSEAGPGPGPGPDALGLKLPYGYMFVSGEGSAALALTSSGSGYRLPLAADGTIVQIERSVIWIEQHAPYFYLRPTVKTGAAIEPSPNSVICATRRSGSSGNSFAVLTPGGLDPSTGKPAQVGDLVCEWSMERLSIGGAVRYAFHILFEGKDYYIDRVASDAASGRKPTLAVGTVRKTPWLLVGMESEGQKLPP